MSRAKYQPWLDMPEPAEIFTTRTEDRIRFGYPAFNRLPTGGDWYVSRWRKVRVRVSYLEERKEQLRVVFYDTAKNGEYSMSLFDFFDFHTLTAGQPVRTVMDGCTPADLLAACGLVNNDAFRMVRAVEAGYGRWLSLYRRLGLTIPQEHQWGFCPVCQQREAMPELKQFRVDPRENRERGICHCIWCGQHCGIELISAARGVSLIDAAALVLAVTEQGCVTPPISNESPKRRVRMK